MESRWYAHFTIPRLHSNIAQYSNLKILVGEKLFTGHVDGTIAEWPLSALTYTGMPPAAPPSDWTDAMWAAVAQQNSADPQRWDSEFGYWVPTEGTANADW